MDSSKEAVSKGALTIGTATTVQITSFASMQPLGQMGWLNGPPPGADFE